MSKRPRSAEASTFFIAVVALSIATWQISFTLGAYGEVFFHDILLIWIASLAALLASIIIGRTQEDEKYFSWTGSVLLLVPTILMFSGVLGLDLEGSIVWALELLLLAAIPYIGYILLTVAAPESVELQSTRLRVGLVFCVLVLNLASYGIGKYNHYFFYCKDFVQAGSEAPDGCWK